jgi:transcriptional regulator with XRE-family HTH domain
LTSSDVVTAGDWCPGGANQVEDPKIVQRNLALQREWYGEPLGDRVRRLVRAFNISQATLADALGISAPMLSQVMSGRRAKIGNPSVLARMIMLERKVFIPDVAAGKPEAMRQALLDVRDSRPQVGRDVLPVDGSTDATAAVAALRNLLSAEDLDAAADMVDEEFPELADLLRAAAAQPKLPDGRLAGPVSGVPRRGVGSATAAVLRTTSVPGRPANSVDGQAG